MDKNNKSIYLDEVNKLVSEFNLSIYLARVVERSDIGKNEKPCFYICEAGGEDKKQNFSTEEKFFLYSAYTYFEHIGADDIKQIKQENALCKGVDFCFFENPSLRVKLLVKLLKNKDFDKKYLSEALLWDKESKLFDFSIFLTFGLNNKNFRLVNEISDFGVLSLHDLKVVAEEMPVDIKIKSFDELKVLIHLFLDGGNEGEKLLLSFFEKLGEKKKQSNHVLNELSGYMYEIGKSKLGNSLVSCLKKGGINNSIFNDDSLDIEVLRVNLSKMKADFVYGQEQRDFYFKQMISQSLNVMNDMREDLGIEGAFQVKRGDEIRCFFTVSEGKTFNRELAKKIILHVSDFCRKKLIEVKDHQPMVPAEILVAEAIKEQKDKLICFFRLGNALDFEKEGIKNKMKI